MSRRSRLVRRTRVSAAALVLGLVAMVLGGCSDDVPEGWTMVDLDGLRFAQPAELSVEEPALVAAFWEHGVVDAAPLEDATLHLRATGFLGDDEFAHVGASRLLANYRHALPGFEVVSEDEVEIDGASSATRLRYRYEADDGRQIDGVWLVAADLAERRSAAVDLAGRNLNDEMVRQLEATMRLEPREGAGDPQPPVEG